MVTLLVCGLVTSVLFAVFAFVWLDECGLECHHCRQPHDEGEPDEGPD
jgi:hypothetical protein